ncbi:hypothetical protein [Rhodococcus opacus]|uniref:hypothetical protein n=1 Tax=Rhodococcus opacus TaxID=37919 RepID=UPI001C455940|nr:hypothetical protein [Rhodococcus opacus]MBV6758380.1 hypothetical protein [Rhodococcus opacus]
MRDVSEPNRPCRDKPGFLQPGEYPFWHLAPETVAAQEMCGHCPFRRTCAGETLDNGYDGVVAASVICRGDDRTRDMLEQIAGRTTPIAPVIPIAAARTTHCLNPTCRARLVKQSETPAAGEARRGGRGLCMGCYAVARRAGRIEARRLRPLTCKGCSLPMVAAHRTPPAGHVEHEANDYCTGCARARRYAEEIAA